MKLKYRNGILIEQEDTQERLLTCLYGSCAGRGLLKVLTRPWLSKAAGVFLSSRFSVPLIAPFIRKNQINMSEFETQSYGSYNEFFSRKIQPQARPIDLDPEHLIAPCDSKLTVLPITEEQHFTLKQTDYTVTSLLKNSRLAKHYEGGYALIFRLTVDDYHRYCYMADGEKKENVRIPGVLHTVNPIANDHYPIYKENSREYTLIRTNEFGTIVQMEVGALLVGRIVNHHGAKRVRRGEEKGYFQFGGSTVVLLLQPEKAEIDEDILNNSAHGIETVVRMGEKIGAAVPNESTNKISKTDKK